MPRGWRVPEMDDRGGGGVRDPKKEKKKKKEAMLSKHDDCWMVSQVPGTYFCWGHFLENQLVL